jgi:hypothetical protein
VLYLQFHPDWLGVLAFDQFGEVITKLREPPYVDGSLGEWKDLDDAETMHWLSDYMAEPTAATVRTASSSSRIAEVQQGARLSRSVRASVGW